MMFDTPYKKQQFMDWWKIAGNEKRKSLTDKLEAIPLNEAMFNEAVIDEKSI